MKEKLQRTVFKLTIEKVPFRKLEKGDLFALLDDPNENGDQPEDSSKLYMAISNIWSSLDASDTPRIEYDPCPFTTVEELWKAAHGIGD